VFRIPAPRATSRDVGEQAGRARVLSDGDLVALLNRREEITRPEFDDRYARIAFKLSLRVVREPAIADEVVEETLDAAWDQRAASGTTLQLADALVALVHRKSVERAPRQPARSPSCGVPVEESPHSTIPGAWAGLEQESVSEALIHLPPMSERC
jgi:hypothetical protein